MYTSFSSRALCGAHSCSLCAGCLTLCEFIHESILLLSRAALFSWCPASPPPHPTPNPRALTFILPPLLLCSLRAEGHARDIPLRVDCPKVSVSAYRLAVGLKICSHLLLEEASLMMAEQGSDLLPAGVEVLSRHFYFSIENSLAHFLN